MIDRNTTIPTKKSQVYSTAEDNQQAVTIRVFQGEREMAADNKMLGQFDLVGIPSAPRGVPQIEVTFDIDSNGIVHVSAKDLGTGKEQKIVIKASSGLSAPEIDRMVKDAERFKEEDHKKREEIDARNQADALVYQTEKNLKEYGDKISDDDKKRLEADVESAKNALKTDNAGEIKSATDRLNATWQDVAQRMYQQASSEGAPGAGAEEGAAQGGPQGEAPSGGPGGAVDAEYEVIDGDNKKKQ